ncbi:hypothetical protein QFC22_005397 [Naganishia vaughanmartiniae]|uniref:Uncharacterized protein n=1 Tax=Naganishia vaughanmartiniae TaxID=1424756 RepID=A0ACC2WVC6_9TREE|nr:hypothetical protein QFC22_005397 [Naganishia vaughanmartiniae]
MSVFCDPQTVASSPHRPLPLDPIPQTLQELIQQKERWSPTPISYFNDHFNRNASHSPSPSPAKRRRIGNDISQCDTRTVSQGVLGETSHSGGRREDTSDRWGLDEEVTSISFENQVSSRPDHADDNVGRELEQSTSLETGNDGTRTTTTATTVDWLSNETTEMFVDNLNLSVPAIEGANSSTSESHHLFEPALAADQYNVEPMVVKKDVTASAIPPHVPTRRQAVPLSPKQINIPEIRTSRSLLREPDVDKRYRSLGGENANTQEPSATKLLQRTLLPAAKPKGSVVPDVFCSPMDTQADMKPIVASNARKLQKTVSTSTVKATFIKPALPAYGSLRGPANALDSQISGQDIRSSSKKAPNMLSAKPSVFYDAPAEGARSLKRAASTSLMDTALSAAGDRESILSLRKKRRIDGSVTAADYVSEKEGGEGRKERVRQDPITISKQQPQKNLERAQLEDYKRSYTKAFPSFIFLFEIDADKAHVRELKEKIKRLGGATEEFLSKKITHYITAKDIGPTTAVGPSAQKPANTAAPFAAVNTNLANRRSLSSRVNGEARSLLKIAPGVAGSKESLLSPYKSPGLLENKGMSSVALQAQSLGIKVWSLSKLARVLSMLIDPESVASGKNQKDTDLSTLLEDERLHGTRERDAMAKRSDWHYFQETSNFLLVEDATGENRPLMYKVYDKPTPVQTPAWPVLYSSFLKPSRDVLNRSSTVRPDQLRDRAISLWVKRESYGDEKPPPLKSSSTLFDNAILTKKPVTRSVSLNHVPLSDTARYHREDSIMPYAAASGNSVVLTSNIASTTSQRHNHSADFSTHGIPDYGKDKRIVQMNKRVQLLKGKASGQLAEKKQLEARKVLAEQNMTYGDELAQGVDPMEGESSFVEEGPSSRRSRQDSSSAGGTIRTSFPRAASSLDVFGDGNAHRSMDELIREKVMKILDESRRPSDLSMSQIRAMKLASKRKGEIERFDVEAPPKAGYCENCRAKYESFEEHCQSRRHRKFAEAVENFASLDQLLHAIRRPEPDAEYTDYNTLSPPVCPLEAFRSGDGVVEEVSEEDWVVLKAYYQRKLSMQHTEAKRGIESEEKSSP